jgi:hypothetical protein
MLVMQGDEGELKMRYTFHIFLTLIYDEGVTPVRLFAGLILDNADLSSTMLAIAISSVEGVRQAAVPSQWAQSDQTRAPNPTL